MSASCCLKVTPNGLSVEGNNLPIKRSVQGMGPMSECRLALIGNDRANSYCKDINEFVSFSSIRGIWRCDIPAHYANKA